MDDSSGESSDIEISAGAADIEILVPDNVAAHIDIASPLGSTWTDPARFMEIEDDVYRSVNYSESRNRVWVDIEALFANVTVR